MQINTKSVHFVHLEVDSSLPNKHGGFERLVPDVNTGKWTLLRPCTHARLKKVSNCPPKSRNYLA